MTRLPTRLRTFTLFLASGLLLAACSNTPLEQAPVSQANPTAAQEHAAPQTPPAPTSVAPVTTASTAADLPGPAGAARVIYFDYDSSTIRPEFREVLDAHARYLARHKERKLTVFGHTDERGGHEYNVALGQQRAESVRRALELLGAAGLQVEAVSFGEEKPAAEGHEEDAWSKNRRAELAYR